MKTCVRFFQAYIEGENKRLENDELRCFDPREIMVRVEVKLASYNCMGSHNITLLLLTWYSTLIK